ncbi:hypothetical protein DSO57_1032089 [Entomophthora muscae]|uniref:Uncharacterized protein n=1 Tax=Entomophthora muscae TaxID=34485 RepID=A0ACC2S2L8_9FUNG|nr:hypothetical protein DSO57_1032089 [Entomophthora muscae]
MSRTLQWFSKFWSQASVNGAKFNIGLRRPVLLNPNRQFSMSVPFGLGSSKPTHSASGTNNLGTRKLNDPKLLRHSAFINGQWLTTSDYKSFEVIDPAESVTFTSLPDLGSKEANFAIQSAHDAFTGLEWGDSTVRYRHDLLMKLHRSMMDNKADLANIITKENGKVIGSQLYVGSN